MRRFTQLVPVVTLTKTAFRHSLEGKRRLVALFRTSNLPTFRSDVDQRRARFTGQTRCPENSHLSSPTPLLAIVPQGLPQAIARLFCSAESVAWT